MLMSVAPIRVPHQVPQLPPMCSTTLMEATSDELPRPPHFLLNNNNNTKSLVVGMAPASPEDSATSEERVGPPGGPLSPCSPGGRSTSSPARCEDDDDEISVGCPSPSPHAARDDRMSDEEDYRRRHYRSGSSSPEHRQEDDYFKPLKKLKMMQINKQARKLRRQSASPPTLPTPLPPPPPPPVAAFESEQTPSGTSPTGVKSFSIMDILNHRPRPAHSPVHSPVPPPPPVPCPSAAAMHRVDAAHAAVGLMLQSPAMLAAAASAASRIVRPWDFGGMLDPAIMMERLHQQQQTLRRHQQHVQHVQQQHLHLQQQAAAHHQAQQALSLSRPQSADLSS